MNTPNQPSQSEADKLQQHASAAVHSHRWKIQALTVAAFVLGFLAVAASITIVTVNEMYVRPKQEKLAADSGAIAGFSSMTRDVNTQPETVQARMLSLEIDMMRVVSMGSMMVAGSVGLLGLGTLLLVAAVTLNRRATLNQVNASLAQISAQLREWRPDGSTDAGRPS